jgi:hypothetical protein
MQAGFDPRRLHWVVNMRGAVVLPDKSEQNAFMRKRGGQDRSLAKIGESIDTVLNPIVYSRKAESI